MGKFRTTVRGGYLHLWGEKRPALETLGHEFLDYAVSQAIELRRLRDGWPDWVEEGTSEV